MRSLKEQLYDEWNGYRGRKIDAERKLDQFLKEHPGADAGGLAAAPAEYQRMMDECRKRGDELGINFFFD